MLLVDGVMLLVSEGMLLVLLGFKGVFMSPSLTGYLQAVCRGWPSSASAVSSSSGPTRRPAARCYSSTETDLTDYRPQNAAVSGPRVRSAVCYHGEERAPPPRFG